MAKIADETVAVGNLTDSLAWKRYQQLDVRDMMLERMQEARFLEELFGSPPSLLESVCRVEGQICNMKHASTAQGNEFEKQETPRKKDLAWPGEDGRWQGMKSRAFDRPKSITSMSPPATRRVPALQAQRSVLIARTQNLSDVRGRRCIARRLACEVSNEVQTR